MNAGIANCLSCKPGDSVALLLLPIVDLSACANAPTPLFSPLTPNPPLCTPCASFSQLAANLGKTEAVEYLLDNCGYDLEYRNSYGNTLVHRAASGGRIETLDMLVGRGADVFAINNNGDTPLLAAAAGGKRDMVRLLVICFGGWVWGLCGV